MHQITGFFFTTNAKTGKRYVIYSTKYPHGRYASVHDCTGMTEQQARGAFVVEHSKEVDLLLKQKKANETTSKIIIP